MIPLLNISFHHLLSQECQGEPVNVDKRHLLNKSVSKTFFLEREMLEATAVGKERTRDRISIVETN
jgi:hypothetical protein